MSSPAPNRAASSIKRKNSAFEFSMRANFRKSFTAHLLELKGICTARGTHERWTHQSRKHLARAFFARRSACVTLAASFSREMTRWNPEGCEFYAYNACPLRQRGRCNMQIDSCRSVETRRDTVLAPIPEPKIRLLPSSF